MVNYTKLYIETLESRETPAVLYNYELFTDDPPPMPGYNGPLVYGYVRYDNNVTLDRFFVPAADAEGNGIGGPRITIRSGGTGQFVEKFDPIKGIPYLEQDQYNEVLYDGWMFDKSIEQDPSTIELRFAFDIVGIDRGQNPSGEWQSGKIYATYIQKGAGPVVWEFDCLTKESREFLAADPNYRNGLKLESGTVYLADIDPYRPVNSDLIVTPNEGGGPIVRAYDINGEKIVDIVVDDPSKREGVKLSTNTLLGILVDESTREYGFGIELPGGGTRLLTWNGRIVSDTFPGDPGTEWRL